MFFNYMYSVINEKKSSPVSSFTTLIFFLTAVGHVTLVHLLPFPECQRGLFRCDRYRVGEHQGRKKTCSHVSETLIIGTRANQTTGCL